MLRAKPYWIACLFKPRACVNTCHYEELTEAVTALLACSAITGTGNDRASLRKEWRALPERFTTADDLAALRLKEQFSPNAWGEGAVIS